VWRDLDPNDRTMRKLVWVRRVINRGEEHRARKREREQGGYFGEGPGPVGGGGWTQKQESGSGGRWKWDYTNHCWIDRRAESVPSANSKNVVGHGRDRSDSGESGTEAGDDDEDEFPARKRRTDPDAGKLHTHKLHVCTREEELVMYVSVSRLPHAHAYSEHTHVAWRFPIPIDRLRVSSLYGDKGSVSSRHPR